MDVCVDVALGLLIRADKVLITQRSAAVELPGLWEFPGGKQQAGESIYQTLCRELAEELDIQTSSASRVFTLWHRYAHANVLLHVFKIDDFTGNMCGKEGQPVRWVSINKLFEYNFPSANDSILALFKANLL